MAIFPTAYFPCISYVARLLADDAPVIEIFDTYHKQTYRNRCHVMTANGVQMLSVPVKQVNGNHTMTKDMVISTVEPWQQIHRRCLESAYMSSPYFEHYYSYLSPIFEQHFEKLIDLNDAALKAILKMLKVKKEISYTSDYVKEAEEDFRNVFVKWNPESWLMKVSDGALRLRSVPEETGALRLRSAAPQSTSFNSATPQATIQKSYYQVFENKFPFAPDLSVLDLIFNEGPETMDYINALQKM